MDWDPRKRASPPDSLNRPALKICGLRHPRQALAIGALGVEAIGVIGVAASPRYLEPQPRRILFQELAAAFPNCRGVLVVADPDDSQLTELAAEGGHRVLQLHGRETPERCSQLRHQLGLEVWKALRIRSAADLQQAQVYGGSVDALLLDAWVEGQLGGTGQALPLQWLQNFAPPMPWWLAGGITPERAGTIVRQLRPDGLDVSSGVETAPGEKDLSQVQQLLDAISGSAAIPAV